GGGWPLVVVSNGRREGETPAGEPGCSQSRQRRMEPIWSPVVATGGNHRQIERTRKPQKQAKSVATGCHRLPLNFHGKQGVCRGLPPVAGGPLPEREEVDLPKNAKSCEPEGPQDLTR